MLNAQENSVPGGHASSSVPAVVPGLNEITLSGLIDGRKIGRYQITILLLCALCVVFDGFDAQAMGFVAPAIKQEWNVLPSVLGSIFSASLFGMVVGSLVFSVVADRIGRRPVLIGAVMFSGLLMLMTSYVQSIEALLVMRFITGVGLGSIMPNALALTSEFSPARQRTFLVMMMACCFSFGAALGGATAAILIPDWGWRSVFLVGGVGPIAIGILMIFMLPESMQVLLLKKVNRERIIATYKRIAPDYTIGPETRLACEETARQGTPIKHLFREGRGGQTLLLWLMHFANLAVLYFLAGWLPTLMRESGLGIRTAVSVGVVLQVGSLLGAVVLARLISRFGFFRVLPCSYSIGALSIGAIGYASTSAPALFVAVFVAGFCVIGGLNGINALAVSSYPSPLRSTGIGWALGIGRFGSILAPIVGGMLIAMQWSMSSLFMVAAVPVIVLVASLLFLRHLMRGRTECASVPEKRRL